MTNDDLMALASCMASCRDNPLRFVQIAFPWGEGELQDFLGPDEWQIDVLEQIHKHEIDASQALRIAIASGHGIGKSALVSWIILWALATQADTKGVVTANTENQLRTKTWAELAKWYRLFIGKHLFAMTATAIFSADKAHEKTWRVDAVAWSETNTEAFAGLHNKGKRVLLVFDEASAISDTIFEVSEGALTDSNTDIVWVCFGNPTRNTGRFKECFYKLRHRWYTRHIDARRCKMGNQEQFREWAEDYGEDSDFFRVRVRGEFPRAGENQFIDNDVVEQAMQNKLTPKQYNFAPYIIGVDPSFDGGDEFVIYGRQGARAWLLGAYPKNDNDARMAQIIADLEDKHKAQAVFIDKGYGTGLYSFGRTMGRGWRLVAFGGADCRDGYKNKRAEMWDNMKQWLKNGASLDYDVKLRDDLIGIEAYVNEKGQLQLEKKTDMKRRGLHSPDRADALALTFAYPVRTNTYSKFQQRKRLGTMRKAGSM